MTICRKLIGRVLWETLYVYFYHISSVIYRWHFDKVKANLVSSVNTIWLASSLPDLLHIVQIILRLSQLSPIMFKVFYNLEFLTSSVQHHMLICLWTYIQNCKHNLTQSYVMLTQLRLRNTDGLLAHIRATIRPTDGLLHFRLKNDIFKNI